MYELQDLLVGVFGLSVGFRVMRGAHALCDVVVTTRRIEPSDEIPRLSLGESEGNRIKL